MPVKVRHDKAGWVIYEVETGKVVGHSTSKEKAQSSANARNAAKKGWKPTGKPRKKG